MSRNKHSLTGYHVKNENPLTGMPSCPVYMPVIGKYSMTGNIYADKRVPVIGYASHDGFMPVMEYSSYDWACMAVTPSSPS